MKPDPILSVASHGAIKALDNIATIGTPEQKLAAEIARLALLALRDTVNRPDTPAAYNNRIGHIRELVRE